MGLDLTPSLPGFFLVTVGQANSWGSCPALLH